LARGEDPRVVVADEESSSVGHRETFEDDVDDADDLVPTLLSQADRVAARLRAAGRRARVAVLILKYDDFRQITRQLTLEAPSSDGNVLAAAAFELLHKVAVGSRKGQRIRLCGLSATGLVERDAPRQLLLEEEQRARGERLGEALDKVKARFGGGLVRRAVHLDDEGDES
jgi:DNA polymerase-4